MTTNDLSDLEDIGPIDYLVVEFPGSKMTGEGLPLLVDLVDRGIIRILDFVFVKKELDGSVRGVAIADLDKDGQLDLTVFEGASSGPPGPGGPGRGWRRARAGQLGRAPGLREPLGGPLRQCPAAWRRPGRRQWPHPGPGRARHARRHRVRRLVQP